MLTPITSPLEDRRVYLLPGRTLDFGAFDASTSLFIGPGIHNGQAYLLAEPSERAWPLSTLVPPTIDLNTNSPELLDFLGLVEYVI